MMKVFETVLGRIDALSEWTGKAVSWLVLVLILSIVYDVFVRYVLDAPTIWCFDTSYMLVGAVYVTGLAYVLHHNANVRVDIVSSHFGPKLKLFVELFFTLVFFFPFTSFLLWTSLKIAIHSCAIRELASYTIWYPPIYPLRALVPLGLLLLLLQGMANFARDSSTLMKLIKGEPL